MRPGCELRRFPWRSNSALLSYVRSIPGKVRVRLLSGCDGKGTLSAMRRPIVCVPAYLRRDASGGFLSTFSYWSWLFPASSFAIRKNTFTIRHLTITNGKKKAKQWRKSWRWLVTLAKRGKGVKRISNTEARSPAAMTWAQRLKRVFKIEACSRCCGTVRVRSQGDRPTVCTIVSPGMWNLTENLFTVARLSFLYLVIQRGGAL